ncbi:DUF1501 domain-containing protein [Aquabacterium olei]|nr:DUF1501 domain-containing protein [Aquabacterium olei]
MTSTVSRRLFLQQAGALTSAGLGAGYATALNLAAMGSASAQSAGDQKALVCVYLAGGNDSFNTVLPTDDLSWKNYAQTRTQQPESIVLPRDKVLALYPAVAYERTIALHPQLKQMQRLFNSERRLAVLANVGTLIEPLSKAQYVQKTRRVPPKLFSHNDQATTWQALGPEGASIGWGGRIADIVAGSNSSSLFTAISAAGNTVWLSGSSVRQYQLGLSGPVTYGYRVGSDGRPTLNSNVAADVLIRVAKRDNIGPFGADLSSVAARSISAEQTLRSALPSSADSRLGVDSEMNYISPVTGQTRVNPLARQLRVIARMLAARDTLGLKRQVFFVQAMGFDTHDGQMNRHAELLSSLDHAFNYFDETLGRLNMRDSVTTFTASDFGRTFTSNGDGTDHGWGGHHFIMGGAVKGGRVLGELPVLGTKNLSDNWFDSSPNQVFNGALLPTTSVEQYGAAMARWMGIADSQLSSVFPNIGNFSSSGIPSPFAA